MHLIALKCILAQLICKNIFCIHVQKTIYMFLLFHGNLKNVMMVAIIKIIDIKDIFCLLMMISLLKMYKTITRKQINMFIGVLLVSILWVRQIFSTRYIMTHEILTHRPKGMRVDVGKYRIVDACIFKQCQVLFANPIRIGWSSKLL